MSSSTSSGSLAASLFTTTMFVMALSFTAEAFMVRSLADHRSIDGESDEINVERESLIGMTIFVAPDVASES
jgi:predicted Kef-type K+ transport protein